MNKKLLRRFTAFLCAFVMCTALAAEASVTVSADTASLDEEGYPVAPDLVSEIAILIDADTGAVLYEKNAHEKSYPASTTKILTGLLACENDTLSDTITMSYEAASSVSYGDSTLGFLTGEELTVEQALYGLLLYSANELAYALAEYTAGSLSAFVDMMNERAQAVGATETHFANASGLYDADHYTTAYDMALIARECFKNPTFMQIDSTTYYEIGPTNKTDETRQFYNRNKLLPGLSYGYDYCTGGKTGYVDEGGYTYVGSAEKDGMRLIVVLFRSGEYDRFTDAETLFEWGFDNFSHYSLTDVPSANSFTGSSYLKSRTGTMSSYGFSFTTSYITAPNSADVSTVTMTSDSTSYDTVDNVSTSVTFTLGSHTVGTSTLQLSLNSTAGIDLPDDLPAAEISDEAATTRNSFVINLWIPIIALLIYLICRWRKAAKIRAERRKQIIQMRRRRDRESNRPY
ncbi:MAG: D-alanyl-D-alanine carboxypeptidase family protein [Lachnospiraceae bacterium]